MDEGSRVFWVKRNTTKTSNEDTLFFQILPFELCAALPVQRFRDFYKPIREWIATCRPPGLSVVAVDADGVQARGFLKAKEGEINTAVVGRHARAEIQLNRDPSISLRHLAVILYPTRPGEDVRFRIVDLRTASGFIDARGAERRAIESNGPYLLGCGGYSIVFAPVSKPHLDWPDEPESFDDAFDANVLTNPETLDRLAPESREEPLGELVVASGQGAGAVPVSRRAVASGILLGRSERCDGDVILLDRRISRVHLLLVEIAGRLYAIDTASKNGVFGKRKAARVTPLETGTSLSLSGVATVEWRFFH